MSSTPSRSRHKPKKFGVGLTLDDVNLIEDSLQALGQAEPSTYDRTIELRSRLHQAVERQVGKEQQSKAKKRRPSMKSTDAMYKRLPGSFESGR